MYETLVEKSKAILYITQDAREAMRVVFSVLTKRICMHKTSFLTLTTPDILYSIASLHLVYLWPWSLWRQLNWPNSSSPHRFNLAELCKLKKIMFYTKKIEYNIIVTIKLILKNLIIFQLIFCPNQYDIYFQRYSLKIIQDITLWCSCKLILLYNC